MTFNESIHYKLDNIFREYDLRKVDEIKNFIKLKSKSVTIMLSYDDRENGGALYAGENEESAVLINFNTIRKFFVVNLEKDFIFPEKNQNDFIDNLVTFFKGPGRALLEGNSMILQEIESYIHNKNKMYTEKILQEQNLISANEAWDKGNYKSFIYYIDKISLQNLPPSYSLKYKIAYQKILN